jgi:aspartate/glutamate racemase
LERQALNEAYFRMTQTRTCTPEQRNIFDRAAQKLMRRGAEAILLGGTDFSLAYGVKPAVFPTIDPVQVHVSALSAYITR